MSTIEFQGTGGIIEGNLGSHNVNVNLDSTVEFSGDDYITIPSASDLDFGTNDFSISMWVKFEAGAISTSEQHLINRGQAGLANSFTLRCNSSENLFFRFSNLSNSGNYDLDPSNLGSWTHIAITFDRSANAVLYINGVSKITQDISSVSSNAISNAQWLIGGENSASPANLFKGNVADVKFFGDLLTETEIKQLASKINVDSDTFGIDNRKAWYKINEGTGQTITDHDDSGTDYDATMTNGTWIYDEYTVDVYDNSTTTDGTFTVTQGKVESLALSSGLFDGDDDFVELGSQSGDLRLHNSDAAISLWFRPHDGDAGDQHKRILDKSSGGSAVGGYALLFHTDGTNGRISGYIDNASTVSDVEPTGGFVDNRFYHILWTWDGTNHNMYIDGVLEKTVANSARPPSDTTGMRIGSWNHSTGREFDGNIRDVKIFDYAFSAEQAASIYSGTYPQTALHQYKLDEGSGTAATDSGTSSTLVNGVMTNGATYTNGTLDLDDDLFIGTAGDSPVKGFLSAPRGVLNCAGFFRDNGTFTHNSGEVIMSGAGQDIDGNSTTTFFNLTSENFVDIQKSINVENKLKTTGGNSWRFENNQTITMGTATSAGEIETGTASGKGMRFVGANKTYKFEAVNPELFPWVGTDGGAGWNVTATGNTIELKGCDMQFAFDTQGSAGNQAVTWKLTGDCEFDAVTVSSGDTLDLNGQRVECSNTLSILGTCDLNNALIYMTGAGILNDDGTDQNAGTCTLVQQGTSTTVADPPTGVGTFLYNQPSVTQTIGRIANTHIIGCGTQHLSGTPSGGSMTIATGGTVDANDETITLSGDFTTSGGLIGTSAITLDGTDKHYSTVSAVAVGTNSAWTIEGWMKRAVTTGNEVFVELKNDSHNNNRVFFNIDTDDVQMLIYSNSGSSATVSTTGQGLNDDKWHHVACTYDSTTAKIYIDGKLVKEEVISKTMDNTDNRVINVGANVGTYANGFTGSIDEVRIWDDVRTPTEIRDNMFSEVSSGDGLVQNWRFNDGTGDSANANVGTSLNGRVGGNSASSQSANLWAGSGTFNTSNGQTLTMTGGSGNINYTGDLTLRELTVSGSCTLNGITGGDVFPLDDTTISGTLASSSNDEALVFGNSFVSNSGVLSFGGNISAVHTLKTTHTSGTIDIPNTSTKRLFCTGSGGTTRAVATVTFNEELQVDSGSTFNANGNTITCAFLDVNEGATVDLRNSTYLGTTAGSLNRFDFFHANSTNSLLTGNTTITGTTSPLTQGFFPSGANLEIVGNMSNINVKDDGDITVVGSVTNCTFANPTGNIRQWHHTLDTQQLLDADEAGDDDLRLTKPALDNALELMTK